MKKKWKNNNKIYLKKKKKIKNIEILLKKIIKKLLIFL